MIGWGFVGWFRLWLLSMISGCALVSFCFFWGNEICCICIMIWDRIGIYVQLNTTAAGVWAYSVMAFINMEECI